MEVLRRLQTSLSTLLYPPSSTSTESEYFLSTVICAETKSARDILMPSYLDTEIRFLHQRVIRYHGVKYHGDNYVTATVQDPLYTNGDRVVDCKLYDFKLFVKRWPYKKLIAKVLDDAFVPEDQKKAVIEKLFKAIKVAVPGHNILVYMLDTRSKLPKGPNGLSLLLSLDDNNQRIVDRIPMPMYESAHNPAPVSVLGHLERVRIDSLESSIRKMSCAICWEDLDHFAVEEEGIDDHQQMIARLPCLHLYHGDCIDQWLEQKRECPSCRRSVKETSGSQHLFFMAAGGLNFRGYVCV